ncbi:MAG: CHC2 zinc finger domain-containing protein [Candidatus Pacebacteria bacterium]|nr:CHC2 zinc finger domain-containing protein [Candidatus Paceibacterota bacterium]
MLNADIGYHIYFRCPELKQHSNSGTENNCCCYPFLYADIDPSEKDADGNILKTYSKTELLQRIKNFVLYPSIIVDSGNGYHAYWLLKTPLTDKEKVQYLLNKIHKGLNTDEKTKLLTQLLRVPTTCNIKRNQPIVTEIIDANRYRYSIKEVDTALFNIPDIGKDTQMKATSPSVVNNSFVTFDFSAQPHPLNVKIDNFPDLLDLLKRQNIFLGSDKPNHPLRRTFRCVFHYDERPSANVFISKRNGYYYYKCFGCNCFYDIISICKKVKKKSFLETITFLCEFFGIEFEYQNWVIKQWGKYYQNANLLDGFVEQGYHKTYPHLYKLLKPRLKYLALLNHYGLAKISSDRYMYENHNLFFFSFRYFSCKYRLGYQTLINAVNLFAVLGLIKKIPFGQLPPKVKEKAVREYKQNDKHNSINFYIIPNLYDKLPTADKIAKVLLENKFTISKCMNKIFLINIFGQKFANRIYPDKRTISDRSLAIAKRLESTLVRLIEEHGYTTKKQVVSKTIISGRLKASRQEKERELDRNFANILRNNGFEYEKASKSLKEKYGLSSYCFIIIRKTA